MIFEKKKTVFIWVFVRGLTTQCGNFIIFVSQKFLREIIFWNSRIVKSVISKHLQALNLGFH